MLGHCSSAVIFALALLGFVLVSAQAPSVKVWAVFAFTLYGDSTPSILPRSKILTQYGARQLYAAGSVFRDRYVASYPSDNMRIQNISPFVLDSDEVQVLSTAEQPIVASSQAFMQGLYPPLELSYDAAYNQSSFMSTNDSSTYPFGGYQYPQFITFNTTDLGFEKLAGHTGCPLREVSKWTYRNSAEFQRITQESAELYARLYDGVLFHAFDRSQANYDNAYYVSEYLDHQSVHNSTVLFNLNQEDIYRARWLADQYVHATNDVSLSGATLELDIRSVAGRTLASLVLQAFEQNIQNRGFKNKMVLAFGSHEPLMALASVLQLKDANFSSRPEYGASIAFELYSFENQSFPSYPEASDLYVRLLLHNATGSSTTFTPYPPFGRGPSSIPVLFTEFYEYMQKVSLDSTNWCLNCRSSAVFCSGLINSSNLIDWMNNSLNPVVAGVIGAVITLTVVLLVAVIGFLICGVQQQRHKHGAGGSTNSGKTASGCDVAFKNSRQGRVTTVENPSESADSWEMTPQVGAALRNTADSSRTAGSTFQDEDKEEWQALSTLEPARVREHV